MLDLHVGGIPLREGNDLFEAGRKRGSIRESCDQGIEFFLHSDVFFVVLVDAVRRQAGEVIDLHLASCCYRERSREGEESRALTGVCVTENGCKLRILQCAGADKVCIAGAELIREDRLIAFVNDQGIVSDIALRPLRIRVKGDRADLIVIAIENFRLGNDGTEDNVFTKRVHFLCSEHAGIDDAEVSRCSTLVFDLDELGLGRHRESLFLREDEDRTTYEEAVLQGILDHGLVLGMLADCLLYGILLRGTGIEDDLAFFYEIELSVRREAVLLRQVVPACRQDLCVSVGTEASAADTVDRTLRSALKRMVKSDTVTDQKVRVVMRARSRGTKITDELAAVVELAAPFAGKFYDRSCPRQELLSFVFIGHFGNAAFCLEEHAKRTIDFSDQHGHLKSGGCGDVTADILVGQECRAYRCRERKSCYTENDASVQCGDILGTNASFLHILAEFFLK